LANSRDEKEEERRSTGLSIFGIDDSSMRRKRKKRSPGLPTFGNYNDESFADSKS
jgi:hypothetical protein